MGLPTMARSVRNGLSTTALFSKSAMALTVASSAPSVEVVRVGNLDRKPTPKSAAQQNGIGPRYLAAVGGQVIIFSGTGHFWVLAGSFVSLRR